MNSKNTALILGLVVVIIGLGFWLYQPKSQENGSENPIISDAPTTFTESEILASLNSDWEMTQELFVFRPTYHNQAENAENIWRNPGVVQFIGMDNILVRFEDDNNVHVAVLKYNGSKFELLEAFENQGEFERVDWQNLVNKHGDSDSAISTYATQLVRNGEIVSYETLTKIPENIFIKNYWSE
jgi:hypothetical protein